MEERPGSIGFFFEQASSRIDAIYEFARRECKNLFSGIGRGEQDAPTTIIRGVIQGSIKARHEQLVWISGGDPVKIKGFERMPIIDYLLILDKKIGENKRLMREERTASKKL